MLKHIVLFILKDRSRESREAVRDLMLTMDGRLDMLRELRVNIDIAGLRPSCDIALEITVDDAAALQAYQVHPYHRDVVEEYMKKACMRHMSADYEF